MKGVVKPHAMPTSRKPIVHRKTDGLGSTSVGMSVSMTNSCNVEMSIVVWFIVSVIELGVKV